MKILGYYDNGVYHTYTDPKEVEQFNDILLDKDRNIVAVREHGIWVNTISRLRVTSPIEVINYVEIPNKAQ